MTGNLLLSLKFTLKNRPLFGVGKHASVRLHIMYLNLPSRGKGLGSSAAPNLMQWTRPQREDIDGLLHSIPSYGTRLNISSYRTTRLPVGTGTASTNTPRRPRSRPLFRHLGYG